MSVVFYRSPSYISRPEGPLNKKECARYVEKYKHLHARTPPELSFENVIDNKPLPPCTLNDFMDYLIYVERNAENLQFFLWLREYTARFNALPEAERKLSPEWRDYNALPPDFSPVRGKPQNSSIYDRDFNFDLDDDDYSPMSRDGSRYDGSRHPSSGSVPSNPSIPDAASFITARTTRTAPMTIKTMATITEDANTNVGLKWQAFTVQPFRPEVTRVIAHYIAPGSPRELNLAHRERALVLHALQHTTHPSAFEPINEMVEAILRNQAHPNFVRWAVCNANKPKVFFVRSLGVLGILGGLVPMSLIILSSVPRWWRIIPCILLFIGVMTLVASLKGLCLILKTNHQRDLKPWELDDADPASTFGLICKPMVSVGGPGSGSHASHKSQKSQPYITATESETELRSPFDDFNDLEQQFPTHPAVGIGKEEKGARHLTVDTFGSGNDWDHEEWVEKYNRRPLLRRIFPGSTWVQAPAVRQLQAKIVRESELWAIVATVVVTAGFVAIPNGNFY